MFAFCGGGGHVEHEQHNRFPCGIQAWICFPLRNQLLPSRSLRGTYQEPVYPLVSCGFPWEIRGTLFLLVEFNGFPPKNKENTSTPEVCDGVFANSNADLLPFRTTLQTTGTRKTPSWEACSSPNLFCTSFTFWFAGPGQKPLNTHSIAVPWRRDRRLTTCKGSNGAPTHTTCRISTW